MSGSVVRGDAFCFLLYRMSALKTMQEPPTSWLWGGDPLMQYAHLDISSSAAFPVRFAEKPRWCCCVQQPAGG